MADHHRNPAEAWLAPGAERTGTERWAPQDPIRLVPPRKRWSGLLSALPFVALIACYLAAIYVFMPWLTGGGAR